MTSRYSKVLSYLFSFIWVIKAIESLYLFSHGDALSYHLVWPKLVLNNGIKDTISHFFPIWLSGYFDFIYFIPNFIFGEGAEAQQLGQFIHFFLSLGLGSIILVKFIKHPQYRWLAGISLLTIAESADFFLYAKNDGFIALCSLISFLLIQNNQKYNKYFLGVIFGLAIGTKLSALFFMLPLGLLYLINCLKKKNYDFLLVIFFTIITSLPTLFIKYSYLKSPFFPGLLNLFPGNLDIDLTDQYNSLVKIPASLISTLKNIKAFYFFKLATLTVLIITLFAEKDKRNKKIFNIFIISIGLLLYLVLNGGNVAPRFYFSAYFILTYLAFQNFSSKYTLFFLLLIFADSKIDKSIKRIKIVFNGDNTVSKRITRSAVWNKIPQDSNVIAHAYTQMYYAKNGIQMQDILTTPLGVKYRKSCDEVFHYAIMPIKYKMFPCLEEQIETEIMTFSGFKLYKLKSHLKRK